MTRGRADPLPSFINDPTVAERMVVENRLAIAFLGKMPIVLRHTGDISPQEELAAVALRLRSSRVE